MKQQPSMLGRRFGSVTMVVAVITACANGDATVDDDAAVDGGGKKDGTSNANCPDEQGAYSIAMSGQGCGDLAAASQCVKQSGCGITFASAGLGLNGTASLGPTGAFSGASITEGSMGRTGCTGTWSASTSTLVVDCGGCIATLTRTSTTCPNGNMCSSCNIDLDCQNTCGAPPDQMTWCCDTGMNSCYPAQQCMDQDSGTGTD